MPRGLGDDPLARRKAKVQDAPSKDKKRDSGRSVTDIQESHNDIFFTRRISDGVQGGPGTKPAPPTEVDRPEITEVAEIVKVAEIVRMTQEPTTLEPSGSGEQSAPPTLPETPANAVPLPTQAGASGKSGPQLQKSQGFFGRLLRRFRE